MKKNPSLKLDHSIEELSNQFSQLYSDPKFRWNVPFTARVVGGEIVANKEIVKRHLIKNPPDQRLRYPVNKRLDPWEGSGTFDASKFRVLIQTIERDMSRLKQEIFK